jgi:D-alanine-D-alanine ligase
VIVKPAREDGSIGIQFGAVCSSIKELMERIDYIHAEFDSPALIEEYIEGRELYVGVLGNEKPEALPVVELDLSKLPEGTPKIAGSEVKWEEDTQAYKATKPFFPDDLAEDIVKKLQDTAVQAFQALQLRDYGRIDFRLAPDGTVHVLEVNPNPYLHPTAEFVMAAKKSGRSFTEMIGEIADLAMRRS